MSDPNDHLVKQQKYRAQRIDHDYHKKPHPWRAWMRVLAFGLPLIGIGAIAAVTFYNGGDHAIYEPGLVSNRHIWFNHRCDDCHESANGKFGVVTNQKCEKCHDGPIHNANQVCPGGEKLIRHETVDGKQTDVAIEQPRCASCHTEHKGNQALVEMHDNHCTQCHGNLTLKSGETTYAKQINSFMDGHQNWRILEKGSDPTQLRFNHQKHLKVAYDPYSKFGARTMQCQDCHRADNSNLSTMSAQSARLTDFETAVLKDDREKFYDGILERANGSGVVKYKLTREDLRKLAVDTLSGDAIDRSLTKLETNSPAKKMLFETALVSAIRERLGNSTASGQSRYMLPISYERNCASECHKHEMKVNGVIVPHGPAPAARDFLRGALYPEIVKQTLSSGSMSDADKAKMKLIAKYRAELLKAAKKPLPPSKADADKMLTDMLHADENAFETLKTSQGGNIDDVSKMLAGVMEESDVKGYEAIKGKKKKEEATASLVDALEKAIGSYVDDKPVSADAIDAAVNAKLKDGFEKLFGDAKTVRDKNERGACLFCHEPTTHKAEKPELDAVVAETAIPQRWLNHAVFNHETHRVIDCESCHAQALTSEKTSDVLLPGIQSCQECHNPKGARADCIECHVYHDKSHQLQDRFVKTENLMQQGASGVTTKNMQAPSPPEKAASK